MGSGDGVIGAGDGGKGVGTELIVAGTDWEEMGKGLIEAAGTVTGRIDFTGISLIPAFFRISSNLLLNFSSVLLLHSSF